MAEEIQKFDPSTLMQGVRDRIKATFVSLIPDDQWDKMVENEMQSFFRSKTDQWNNRRDSEFKTVLDSELARRSREAVSKILDSEDFMVTYSGTNRTLVSDYIRKEIIANAPELFARTLEMTIVHAVENMKYKIKEEIRTGQ